MQEKPRFCQYLDLVGITIKQLADDFHYTREHMSRLLYGECPMPYGLEHKLRNRLVHYTEERMEACITVLQDLDRDVLDFLWDRMTQ